MTRRAFTLGVLLLAGAIIAAAIAWACAMWVDPEAGMPRLTVAPKSGDLQTAICERSGFGHTRIDQCTYRDLMLDTTSGDILLGRMEADGSEHSRLLAGWPLRCLACTNHAEITIRGPNSMEQMSKSGLGAVTGGIEVSPLVSVTSGSCWRALPCEPLWIGLAGNSLLFAAMLWMLLFGVKTVRRRHRIQRGLCPACAYPVGVSEVCTECGGPVRGCVERSETHRLRARLVTSPFEKRVSGCP